MWIEIDTSAIKQNIAAVKKMLPHQAQFMAVVKSNAYGHGLFDFASFISKNGADWLGVDSAVEAMAIREQGITTPMLVLGYTLPELLAQSAEEGISLTVSSHEALENALTANLSRVLNIHIKIDTGLHRQGFLPEEVPNVVKKLAQAREEGKKVNAEGVCTHLADAKQVNGEEYSRKQIKVFGEVCKQFADAGFSAAAHILASPGLIRYGSEMESSTALEKSIVRVGAALYGIWPAEEMKKDFHSTISLKPALTWKTLVTELKHLPKGSPIGYNRSEILTRNSLVAVCPIGYWFGYPTSLSSKGIVLVNGKPAKVLGRVTMDMMTIDCTDCGTVNVLDEVTLIDSDQNSPVSASNVAALAGVSVHELLTRLNPKIERIYKK